MKTTTKPAFQPFFVPSDAPHPYDQVKWVSRDLEIKDGSKAVFSMKGVECPASWSERACVIAASKYFRGQGRPGAENSIRHLLNRVSTTIAEQAKRQELLDAGEIGSFERDLAHLLVTQSGSFNSPVWFWVGAKDHPQCSACFINSVEDSMESILELVKTEGQLFKGGSGTGTNMSSLRSSRELLSTGGYASGPVSFMRGLVAMAGAIKSGGATRRAAKMVILDADHPDVGDFIDCKAGEELRAKAMIAAGFDGSMDGEVYRNLPFQNANNSVRVTDEFMRRAQKGGKWELKSRTTGEVIEEVDASGLLDRMSAAAWECGDPGIQYHDTINAWNTCAKSGPIVASNPCSEFVFLNDTACNLASLNLVKFLKGAAREKAFDIEAFRAAVRIFTIAQETLVDFSSYPTPKIAANSRKFRPLGLGYANLGTFLLRLGLPYGSQEAAKLAGAITSLMTAEAYRTSAEIAQAAGSFPGFEENREPFLGVMARHWEASKKLAVWYQQNEARPAFASGLATVATRVWGEVNCADSFRNAQVTVLAPTGTIAFMMDCDTTGIEPLAGLVAYKTLLGGGVMKQVPSSVAEALESLGYPPEEIAVITRFLEENGHLRGSGLKQEHHKVFLTSLGAGPADEVLLAEDHLGMMAEVQPFLSGAISKTVNLPGHATPADIRGVFVKAWEMGLKAVAVYRDGSKGVQPLSAREKAATKAAETRADQPAPSQSRRRLPETRRSITHKFGIGAMECYVTVGLYEDGRPGEIFINPGKQGSTLSGILDSFAMTFSVAMQYGAPLEVMVEKLALQQYEPSGITTSKDPDLMFAASISDYLAKWLRKTFLEPQLLLEFAKVPAPSVVPEPEKSRKGFTGRACTTCGTMMVQAGKCHACPRCGSSSGCS